MNKIIPPPQCNTPECSATMVLKTKDDDQFWGCPNWKELGCKTVPFDYLNPKRKSTSGFVKQDGSVIIMEELKAINNRLDLMARFLKEHLGD